ncbi:MAG: hypothetical protein HWD86_07325 [Kangiellaceae bacterium]|nr:hypothetical protein [Kangiellaceae bacterium]
MSKTIRHILLITAMLSMALVGIAHANAPSHDSTECTICIYQPNTDFHSAPGALVITESFTFAEQSPAWATPVVAKQTISPFFGRAPPISA